MAEIIVALDMPSVGDALDLVDAILGLRWVKVGPTLFLDGGPALVRQLKDRGLKVFLDLKWHDIPHQVEGATGAAAALGVDLATLHCLGGVEMMQAAAAVAGAMRLVGVTVLTSHSPDSYGGAVGRAAPDLASEVARLAGQATQAGLGGVVASPMEIPIVRTVVRADAWIVVPGIRPAGAAPDDQRRTAEPGVAVRAGATHLVVGRPITQSTDPRAVYQQLCDTVK